MGAPADSRPPALVSFISGSCSQVSLESLQAVAQAVSDLLTPSASETTTTVQPSAGPGTTGAGDVAVWKALAGAVPFPIAARGKQVQKNGITYTVVGTEGKVEHVRWKKGGVLCWVSNTISHLLPESELLKLAESFVTVSKP